VINSFNTNLTIQTENPPEGEKGMWLKLRGHLAGDGALVLRRVVEPIFISPSPPFLKLNMTDVEYMDSSGIGVLIGIIQKLRSTGGLMEIHGLSDVGRQLFQILKLASLNEVVTVSES